MSSGRRRATERQYTEEDKALDQISKEAEEKIQARRQARAEAREIRLREIERQQKEEEEKQKGLQSEKSLSGYSGSRRGSNDSTGSDASTSSRDPKDQIRLVKNQLRDLEEKYKAAMVTNAQLDNIKTSHVFQLELLKEQLEEQEEAMIEVQREYKDKCREFELLKRDFEALKLESEGYKQQIAIKDKLIKESGLVIANTDDGNLTLSRCSDLFDVPVTEMGAAMLSEETADLLKKAGEGTLGKTDFIPPNTKDTCNVKQNLDSQTAVPKTVVNVDVCATEKENISDDKSDAVVETQPDNQDNVNVVADNNLSNDYNESSLCTGTVNVDDTIDGKGESRVVSDTEEVREVDKIIDSEGHDSEVEAALKEVSDNGVMVRDGERIADNMDEESRNLIDEGEQIVDSKVQENECISKAENSEVGEQTEVRDEMVNVSDDESDDNDIFFESKSEVSPDGVNSDVSKFDKMVEPSDGSSEIVGGEVVVMSDKLSDNGVDVDVEKHGSNEFTDNFVADNLVESSEMTDGKTDDKECLGNEAVSIAIDQSNDDKDGKSIESCSPAVVVEDFSVNKTGIDFHIEESEAILSDLVAGNLNRIETGGSDKVTTLGGELDSQKVFPSVSCISFESDVTYHSESEDEYLFEDTTTGFGDVGKENTLEADLVQRGDKIDDNLDQAEKDRMAFLVKHGIGPASSEHMTDESEFEKGLGITCEKDKDNIDNELDMGMVNLAVSGLSSDDTAISLGPSDDVFLSSPTSDLRADVSLNIFARDYVKGVIQKSVDLYNKDIEQDKIRVKKKSIASEDIDISVSKQHYSEELLDSASNVFTQSMVSGSVEILSPFLDVPSGGSEKQGFFSCQVKTDIGVVKNASAESGQSVTSDSALSTVSGFAVCYTGIEGISDVESDSDYELNVDKPTEDLTCPDFTIMPMSPIGKPVISGGLSMVLKDGKNAKNNEKKEVINDDIPVTIAIITESNQDKEKDIVTCTENETGVTEPTNSPTDVTFDVLEAIEESSKDNEIKDDDKIKEPSENDSTTEETLENVSKIESLEVEKGDDSVTENKPSSEPPKDETKETNHLLEDNSKQNVPQENDDKESLPKDNESKESINQEEITHSLEAIHNQIIESDKDQTGESYDGNGQAYKSDEKPDESKSEIDSEGMVKKNYESDERDSKDVDNEVGIIVQGKSSDLDSKEVDDHDKGKEKDTVKESNIVTDGKDKGGIVVQGGAYGGLNDDDDDDDEDGSGISLSEDDILADLEKVDSGLTDSPEEVTSKTTGKDEENKSRKMSDKNEEKGSFKEEAGNEDIWVKKKEVGVDKNMDKHEKERLSAKSSVDSTGKSAEAPLATGEDLESVLSRKQSKKKSKKKNSKEKEECLLS